MRGLYRFSQRVLAATGGAAIAALTVGSAQAQYYPYAPAPAYPAAGYPVAAPPMYSPPQSPAGVVPVGALTGDYRNWGWGGGNFSFGLIKIGDAKTFNITLAYHRSRYVEFTALPQK